MRTSSKPDILLGLLFQNKKDSYTYEFLAKLLKVSKRQLYRILCSLQEKGLVKVNKQNRRKHIVKFAEENKMARLRKREIVTPRVDREKMIAGLKKTMNKKKKNNFQPMRIPGKVLQILNHWNSIERVPKIIIPDPVDGLYPNPTKLLKTVVTQLKKVLTGNFFGIRGGAPILQLEEKNRIFTVEEVIQTIDQYAIAAYSVDHKPYNKCYLKDKNLSVVLFNDRAITLENYSLFMHFFENEPELTPAAKAQIYKMEKQRAEGIKINFVKRDEFLLEVLTDELVYVYHKYYGVDDDQELKDLKKVAMTLYDYAQEHGGVEYKIKDWAWHAVGALRWRMERGGNFKAIPKTMLQDWFYDDVLIGYLKFKQIDGLVYLPELTGEDTVMREDRVMTDEEARELFPKMFKYE